MSRDPLDNLVAKVLAGNKYKHITPTLARRIGAQELAKRANLREAIKSTRRKLHQVGGAYFESSINYGQAIEKLEQVGTQTAALQEYCRSMMTRHASTRERLPILEQFYKETLADLPPIKSVLDIACGLNPLARPWMPLGEDVFYTGVDIYADMISFVGAFFSATRMSGTATVQDVIDKPPTQPVDLALILKTIPCLEQVDKKAGKRLLDTIQARYILLSFPVRSLGGRKKGMATTYEARFEELVAGRGWESKRFLFESELAFLVKTGEEDNEA